MSADTEHAATDQVDPELDALETQLANAGPIRDLGYPPEPEQDGTDKGEKAEPIPATPTAEAQPAPKPGEGNEDESDLIPELPEGQHPQRQHFEALRKITSKFKEQRNELRTKFQGLEAQIKELGTRVVAPAPNGAAAPAPDGGKVEIPDHQVFQRLAEARIGRFETPEYNKEIERMSLSVIDTMDSQRVFAVLQAAKAGQYGELSADIAVQAREALAEAQVRDSHKATEQAAKQAKSVEHDTAVKSSFEKVKVKHPDLLDEKTPFAKFMVAWRKQMIVDDTDKANVKQGPLFHVLGRTDWPEVVVQLAHAAFQVAETDNMRKRLQAFEAQEAARRTPESGAGGRPENAPGAETDEDLLQLEQRLKSAGTVGGRQ